jgi:glycosyltransferase involved in cell wall biosynthesis
MRILMLTEFYPPLVGGVEQVVRMLSRDLVARGHDVSVATIHTPGQPEVEDDGGVHVYRLRGLTQRFGSLFSDPKRPFHPPAADPLLTKGIRDVIAAERPDIVHAHSWMLYSFLPLKKRAGAKLVVTLHDYGLFCPKKTLLHQGNACSGPAPYKCLRCSSGTYGAPKAAVIEAGLSLSSLWHRQIDKYLAISSYVKQASVPYVDTRRSEITIVPSFVDETVTGYESRQIEDFPIPDASILFVGALGQHKGIHVLLAAYEQLATMIPLVLVGQEWIDTPRSFPANVQVVKALPHDLIMEAWSRCRFGVVPSMWPEPLGLVAMEALSMRRPVIASASGGLTDIVTHERTGLLVKPGNVDDLRRAMQRLLDDEALGARLGRAGREHVLANFTASAVVPRVEEIYREVLGKHTFATARIA